MILYLKEPGSRLGIDGGHFYVINKYQERILETPIKLVTNIVIDISCSITGKASVICLKHKIPVFFLSSQGKTFGKLVSITDVNVELLRNQVEMTADNNKCLKYTINVISAKIQNQIIYSKRLYRSENIDEVQKKIVQMQSLLSKVKMADSREQIMGIEGMVARLYFQILSEYLPADFKLKKRTKNPPLDPINSIFSFGYALLHSEIYTALEMAELNPYFSFMHTTRKGHAALASDMIEEFRAVIIDPLVVHFVNYTDIKLDDFDGESNPPAVLMKFAKNKEFIGKYEKKMQQKQQYSKKPMSFREALYTQAKQLADCISSDQIENYEAFRIR